jgi:hypothetical protein
MMCNVAVANVECCGLEKGWDGDTRVSSAFHGDGGSMSV